MSGALGPSAQRREQLVCELGIMVVFHAVQEHRQRSRRWINQDELAGYAARLIGRAAHLGGR